MPPVATEPDAEQMPLPHRAIHPSTKYESSPSIPQKIAGGIALLALVALAFLNLAFLVVPIKCVLQPLCGRTFGRTILRTAEGGYFALVSGLLEFGAGVKIVITTDMEDASEMMDGTSVFQPQEQVLLLSNHRTEIDWVFFWNLTLRFQCHDRIRVMMKSIIRYAPGVGWALLLLDHPFINRNWATDEERLTHLFDKYQQQFKNAPPWVAMFPEGTALCDPTLERSHMFAEKQQEPKWNYVLSPRVRGFELCVQELQPDWIVDLTIGYPELTQGIRPSPMRFLRGQYPQQVHIHMTRHHKTSFAAYEGKMDQWLKKRFAAKEALLEGFYKHECFLGKPVICEGVSIAAIVLKGCLYNLLVLVVSCGALFLFPWTTWLWFACCMALSVHRVSSFGN